MLDEADALYLTSQSAATKMVAAVAKPKPTTPQSLDETQPALQFDVNAVQQRGNGRGGRNNRGNRGNRGGRGAGRGNKNNNQNQSGSRWPTPRHEDGPPANSCFNHHTYGRLAFHCTDPLTCGWANIPPNPRPKNVTK